MLVYGSIITPCEVVQRAGGLDTLDARLHFLSEDLILVKTLLLHFWNLPLFHSEFSWCGYPDSDWLYYKWMRESNRSRWSSVRLPGNSAIEAVGDRDSEPHEASSLI